MINLPPFIISKCKSKKCKEKIMCQYKCGGKYYLEIAGYDNGIIAKYMCRNRFISKPRLIKRRPLEEAIEDCYRTNEKKIKERYDDKEK